MQRLEHSVFFYRLFFELFIWIDHFINCCIFQRIRPLMKTSKKKGSKRKEPEWRSFDPNSYVERAKHLVSHGCKGVNSNNHGGGVRVVPQFDPYFPYACTKFAREPVPLTYAHNATDAKQAEQICAALGDGVNLKLQEAAPQDELRKVREMVQKTLNTQEADVPESVGVRLRQILVDDGKGGDVVLSPLPSPGMSWRLAHKIDAVLQRRVASLGKKDGWHCLGFDYVSLPVGGENPQNVGRAALIQEMRRAYRFRTPGSNEELRKAFVRYHQGVSMVPSLKLVSAYGEWLSNHRDERGLTRNTQTLRSKEYRMIKAIVTEILRRGDKARDMVDPWINPRFGPLRERTSPDLLLAVRGVIDPALRNEEWRLQFASRLAEAIATRESRDGVRLAGISRASTSSLEQYILEAM